jgi:hypothetical protein
MKKFLLSSILAIGLLFTSSISLQAQTIEDIFQDFSVATSEESVLFTEIISDEFNNVDSPTVFKANPQFNQELYDDIIYRWEFGDGNIEVGKEVVHRYDKAGLYEAKLTVITGDTETSATQEIFIADQTALLITDSTSDAEKITKFVRNGNASNYYIKVVESFASQSEFLSEEVLSRKLIKLGEEVKNYDTIIVWSNNTSPLNAIARFNQNFQDQNGDKNQANFNNKTFILLKNDFGNTQRAKRIFRQIQPQEVIIMPTSVRHIFTDTNSISELKNELKTAGVEHETMSDYQTKISPFNFFSVFIDYLVNQGIPDNTIILILLLPVIATIIAVFKQVVGISTMGIYMPSIITMAFLILGLKFGLITFLLIVATGIIAHKIFDPMKLLYVPKMALVITTVSIALFILITITVYFKFFAIDFISLTIFPVLVMGTLTERFARLTSTKGFKGSVVILAETIIVCIITYFLAGGTIDLLVTNIQFTAIRNLILNHPEIIILIIGLNIYLGKWTGLQISEILRFRNIINDLEE